MMHGQKTYEWLNQQGAGFWNDNAPKKGSRSQSQSRSAAVKSRTRSAVKSVKSAKSKSKSYSIAQKSFGVGEAGEKRIRLPRLAQKDLFLMLTGNDEFLQNNLVPDFNDSYVEKKFIPNLNAFLTTVTKSKDADAIRLSTEYLHKLLGLTLKFLSEDLFRKATDLPGDRRVLLQYNLWLLNNACIKWFGMMGISLAQLTQEHPLLKTLHATFIAKAPQVLPEYKKWWWQRK